MSFLKWFVFFTALSLISMCCKTMEKEQERQDSSVKFFGYYIRGHEDITRFAISLANKAIFKTISIDSFFPEEPFGTIISNRADAKQSDNPIVYGNVATDFPNDISYRGLTMKQIFPDLDYDHWMKSGTAQNFHFMRNFSQDAQGNVIPTQTVSEVTAKSVDLILLATRKASRNWFKAERSLSDSEVSVPFRNMSLFLIGQALHTIQDSFSPGHARRTPDGKQILDICILHNEEVKNICLHRVEFETYDDIWQNPITGRVMRDWSELTPEAKLAVQVSGAYLYQWAVQLHKLKDRTWSDEIEKQIEATMRNFLVDPTFYSNLSGYFEYQGSSH